MSNVIKSSNLIGPGFNKANFFQSAKEISITFTINDFVFAKVAMVQSDYASVISGGNFIYQDGWVETPIIVNDPVANILYQDTLAQAPVQLSNPERVYAGVTRINITIS